MVAALTNEFGSRQPVVFSMVTPGVKTFIKTNQRIIALTFDACGGKKGDKYNKKLIDYLVAHRIPATLFISGRWIDSNRKSFLSLTQHKLFTIENHGYLHRPLSIDGRSIYGIEGTKNLKEMVEEVEENAAKIEKLTGRRPVFYRPGTGYIDDVGVGVVRFLKQEIVNFNVVPGDANPHISGRLLLRTMLYCAKPGAIIVLHMNKPGSGTLYAVAAFVKFMRIRGYRFVKLEDYRNQLFGYDKLSFNEMDYFRALKGSLFLWGANLSEAVLKGARLDKADLRRANLRGTDFRFASLINVNFRGAYLGNTDFRGADLKGAQIYHRLKKYILLQGVKNFKKIRWIY